MDIATIVGCILAAILILGSIAIGPGGLIPFFDVPSVMITIGGSFAALLINFPMGNCIGMMKVVMKCFLFKLPTTKEVIEQFKTLSAIARRDGLLALEEKVNDVTDDFMSRGLAMVIGGSPKEEIQNVMETEIAFIDERHKNGKKLGDGMGAAAPAFGMIGTLIGLVQMLRSLDDPSKIGGGMAVALLTTLYGAVIANVICIPMAGKLEARNKEEVMIRQLILAGLLSLVEGQSPRTVESRLVAFLSPKARSAAEGQTAA